MIESFFPTLVYYEDLVEFENSNDEYIKKSYQIKQRVPPTNEWNCDTYSTYNTSYELKTDPFFKSLFDGIKLHVDRFAEVYGVNNSTAIMTDAWINIAEPGNFQEFHMHSHSHFSAVYYIKAPQKCGNIIFKSFQADTDMFQLRVDDTTRPENWKTVFYTPIESRLIIFRSNLQHMVAKNMSTEDRISIAMNFVV
jgi:uncharacterized protein (TIGR02466 family)